MQNYLSIIVILITSICNGQPGEDKEFYTQQIDEITNRLEKDPLNYKLIWQRVELQTRVLFWGHHTDLYNHYPEIKNIEEIQYMPNERDYHMIFENVIKKGDFSFVDKGDYYISRIEFFEKTRQINKAIEDAYYLKDISFSIYGGKLEYYQKWALRSLFELHAWKEDYNMALASIEFIIATEKFNNPKSYYSRGNSSEDKIRLFRRFKKKKKIIPYLKQMFWENFDYYFDSMDKKYEIKNVGFGYLQQLVDYMESLDSDEFSKYQKVYEQLKVKLSSGHETMNNTIEDSKLKAILSEL